jgi:hypothetical protein
MRLKTAVYFIAAIEEQMAVLSQITSGFRGSAPYLDDIERCLLWAKYLSKENSKGLAPRHVHEWGASLIRK